MSAKILLNSRLLIMKIYPKFSPYILRHLSSSSPSSNADQYQKFLDLCNQWPADTCNRKITLETEIRNRVTESFKSPNKDKKFCEAEYQSLLRILNNHYRDKYALPSGLGQSKLGSDAPKVAATGADLEECRRILANQDAAVNRKKPLLSKVLPWFFN